MTKRLLKITTLRTFITVIVTAMVALSLLIGGIYFYARSSKVLTETIKDNIISQLKQVNEHAEEQIHIIDSLFPSLITNPVIQENLEPFNDPRSTYTRHPYSMFEVEKQMTQILISTNLWNRSYINSVSIIDNNNLVYRVSLYNRPTKTETLNLLMEKMELGQASPHLEIKTLEDNKEDFYFIRNIYSINTGDKIGTIIIDINAKEWNAPYLINLDKNWNILLFNNEFKTLGYYDNTLNVDTLAGYLATNKKEINLAEIELDDTRFFIASKQVTSTDVTSVVAVSKQYVMENLNKTLRNFMTIFILILVCTIIFTAFFSRTITKPIEKMIVYIRRASKGITNEPMPKYVYSEFNEFADAFSAMLKQLDIYYNELYQKQLLLKNAQIESLQAQMNPHFLFNILNSIAWKAQISGNEDIYQMIVSLGELLRGNILAKEKEFVTLEEEMEYVRFYIYLQQMRFEDRFSISIQIEPDCLNIMVPRFCIQPLVENAIVHGLEPKQGTGKLRVNVIRQSCALEIIVIDNGIGFPPAFDLSKVKPSSRDSSTHIGLKNLDERLSLLYSSQSGLKIESVPDRFTAVSFHIPY